MADTVSTGSRGPGTLSLLGILFVALKLTGVIDWSWWWVTLPFWGVFAFFLAFGIVALVVYVIGGAAMDVRRSRRRKKAAARRLGR